MDSLVQEVVIRSLIAVAIGFVLGWALKQIVYGNKLEKAHAMWRGRLNRAEDERDEMHERVAALDTELTSTEANWAKKYAGLSKERDTLSERVDELAVRERDLESSWQQRVTEIEKERNELNARIQELTTEAGRAASLERDLEGQRAKVRDLTNHLTTAEATWRERSEKLEQERDKHAAEAQRVSAGASTGGTSVRMAELQRERDLYSARVSELTSKLTMYEQGDGRGDRSSSSIENGADDSVSRGTARSSGPGGGIFGSPPPLGGSSGSGAGAHSGSSFAGSAGSAGDRDRDHAADPGDSDDPLTRNTYKVEDVEGVGEVYGRRLRAANIVTTDDLVRRCCDATGRRAVARETGFGESLLLKWANIADLMRVPGVGSESAALLEAAGVDTVNELRHRSPENLAAKMAEVNHVRRLARTAPDAKMVASWVEQARVVPPVVSI